MMDEMLDETKEKILIYVIILGNPKVILAHNSGTKAKMQLNHTSAIKIRSNICTNRNLTTNQKILVNRY